MASFVKIIASTQHVLFYFGWWLLAITLLLLIVSVCSKREVLGINAWHKPIKFFLSSFIVTWTMAWYLHYLPKSMGQSIYIAILISSFLFQDLYITFQAARGQLSHFNLSNAFSSAMFRAMAFTSATFTFATLWVGIQFFSAPLPALPSYYIWSIRLGIILFCVFALQGFMMGGRLKHTVGGNDGGPGLPVTNWSTKYGDLRIAHFLGMHALPIIPLVSYYFIGSNVGVFLFSAIYLMLVLATLIGALKGRPLIKKA